MSWTLRCLLPLLLLALAGVSGACRGGGAPEAILLISVDTLRADHLGAYGYERPTSPNLDRIAQEGVVFEDVTATSPWTLPSHASLLTGLYPSHHGLRLHGVQLPDRIPTLAALLREAGWATAAVVNSQNVSKRFGLHRGFERFRYEREEAGQREPSTGITDLGLEWLRSEIQRPVFLFLHYYDVHSDYTSLPEYEALFTGDYDGPVDGSTEQLSRLRKEDGTLSERDVRHLVDLYDAGIRQMDDELGRLFEVLRREGTLDDTLLVVTSDHGEEFQEHGSVLHGRTHYQEVVRIPLIVRGPGVPRGMRIETPVSLVDVMPTVLAAAGAPLPETLDGVDLAPVWRGETRSYGMRYLYSEADHAPAKNDRMRMARNGNLKLHLDRLTKRTALYDLEADPGEREDVSEQHPERSRRMLLRLEKEFGVGVSAGEARPLSRGEIERLRSLGYLE